MQDLTARVLIRREVTETGAPWWVAQVLEYDLAAQGKNLKDLVYELQRTIFAHMMCCEVEGLVPFECLPPAPQDYHDAFMTSPGLKLEIVRITAARRDLKRGAQTAVDVMPPFVHFQPPKLEYRLDG